MHLIGSPKVLILCKQKSLSSKYLGGKISKIPTFDMLATENQGKFLVPIEMYPPISRLNTHLLSYKNGTEEKRRETR